VARGTPRDRAAAILDALERHHPGADTELVYRTPFELLVATVLSAQSTDRRVNEVTPALFARFPTPAALSAAAPAELEALIHSTGFFRQKAKALIGLSQALVKAHGGDVPADMAALVTLPGVGRKTANVVLGHALGVPGLPVDRHVLRVAGRLGLVHTDDAVKAEAQLTALWPPARWTRASDTLILHGRRICRPAPQCPICNARALCAYALRTASSARPRGAARSGGRPAAPAAAPRRTAARPARSTAGEAAPVARRMPRRKP
jgi:endonuclease-3